MWGRTMTLTIEEQQRITHTKNKRKNKPRKTEIRDEKDLIIQTIEISDDNLIVVTKTNIAGL